MHLTAMSDWIGKPPRTLDELQAFDAMRHFLEAYWERRGKVSDDIAVLPSDVDRDMWANGMPGDPALWNDFRAAVSEVVGS